MSDGAIRQYAPLRFTGQDVRVRHAVGWPPGMAPDGSEAQMLPTPDVIVIEEQSSSSVFLYRMTMTGELAGDTWHRSVEEAKGQARYEYGDAVGEWKSIPADVSDACGFAVAVARAASKANQT